MSSTNSATTTASTTAVSTAVTSSAAAAPTLTMAHHIDKLFEGLLPKMMESAKSAFTPFLSQLKHVYQSNKDEKMRLSELRIQLDGQSIQINQEKAVNARANAMFMAKLTEMKADVTRKCVDIKRMKADVTRKCVDIRRESAQLKREREDHEKCVRSFEAKCARIEFEDIEKQVAAEPVAASLYDSTTAGFDALMAAAELAALPVAEAVVANPNPGGEIEDGPDDESDDEVEVELFEELEEEVPTFKVGELVAVSFATSKNNPVKALAIVTQVVGKTVYVVKSVAALYGEVALCSSVRADTMELVTSLNAISLCHFILSDSNLNSLHEQLKKHTFKTLFQPISKAVHHIKVKTSSIAALKPFITFPDGMEPKRNHDSFINQVAAMV